MTIAITRAVSPAINHCELTHLTRKEIDFETASSEHQAYQAALRDLGCKLHELPADPGLPDSTFVEDIALVFDELAIITCPGAESRRPEADLVVDALKPYRKLAFISSPAMLDGGDVLVIDRNIYVGLSSRTNHEAVLQLKGLLSRFDYRIIDVRFRGCLHLKSAVTQVGPETLLINSQWVSRSSFNDMAFVEVDPAEPHAANALRLRGRVIYPAHYTRTTKMLIAAGIEVKTVDFSELSKAECGVTCCSLIFNAEEIS